MKKKTIKVLTSKLEKKIIDFSARYTSVNNAKIISKIIVRAEKIWMHIPTMATMSAFSDSWSAKAARKAITPIHQDMKLTNHQ